LISGEKIGFVNQRKDSIHISNVHHEIEWIRQSDVLDLVAPSLFAIHTPIESGREHFSHDAHSEPLVTIMPQDINKRLNVAFPWRCFAQYQENWNR
jgi:hypothetical protein